MIGPALRRTVGCLGLLLEVSCASSPAPQSAEPPVQALPPIEGTTVSGHLEPGERAFFSIPLEAGEYFEAHLDQSPEEVRVRLFVPGVSPSVASGLASGFRSTEISGQVLGEVLSASGIYHLRVETELASPVTFRLSIRALRPATPKDLSAQRGEEAWLEAEALRKAGRLREALVAFDRAFELCEAGGYRRCLASTYSRRAKILQAFGRPEEAREQLLAALEIWQALDERDSIAGTFVRLASLEREASRWEEMDRYLETATGMATELGYRDVEANALTTYCKVQMDQGQTEEALASCRRALEIWDEIGMSAEGVDALINLGYMHYYQGNLDEARSFYSRGLAFVETQPDPEREATLLNNLALLHQAAGEYQTALNFFQSALDAYDTLGRTAFSAKVLLNIGRIHFRLDESAKAREFYHQALARMIEADDLLGRIAVLHALADLHVEQDERAEAGGVLEEALELSRRSASRTLLAASLSRIGELHLQEDRGQAALAPLRESLELYRASAHRWGETQLLADLAEAHARLGDQESALDLLFEAATLNDAIGNRAGLAENHFRIARIERDRGNLEAARNAIVQAEAVLDAVRLLLGPADLRALFSATTRPYHELHVEILMAQHRKRPEGGHDAEALRESERARSRSLLEILAEADLEPGPEVAEELLAERAVLQERLNAKEIERQLLLADEATSPAALFRVKLDLERLLNSLREAEERIRAQSPRYAALTHPQPVTAGEIQRSLLDGDTALLEYSLGDERSFLWVVSDSEFRTYELPGRDEIEAAARCFRWLITAYGDPPAPEELTSEGTACLLERLSSYSRSPPGETGFAVRHRRRREIAGAFEWTADELSRLVLAPAADRPLAYRLAVVTDGALEYVPFAALPEPGTGGQPLVRAHELARLPSASVLALQRTQPARAATPEGELAIVADPLYSPDDPRVARAGQESGPEPLEPAGAGRRGPVAHFRRLDFAAQEAAAIARSAASGATYSAQGAEATRETVLGGALSGYRYVHFATHAVVDTQYPQFSTLVLSQVDSEGRPQEDGYLRLHDIYGLELDDADLVVLSACDTALGREIRGEGLVGLTRGFLYAGAERVVASLWQVQDLATAKLMEQLYRGMLEEDLPPAEALREAQLAILEEPGSHFAFPYYWAGFVLQGEWR